MITHFVHKCCSNWTNMDICVISTNLELTQSKRPGRLDRLPVGLQISPTARGLNMLSHPHRDSGSVGSSLCECAPMW